MRHTSPLVCYRLAVSSVGIIVTARGAGLYAYRQFLHFGSATELLNTVSFFYHISAKVDEQCLANFTKSFYLNATV